jgi:hypothetical protein
MPTSNNKWMQYGRYQQKTRKEKDAELFVCVMREIAKACK